MIYRCTYSKLDNMAYIAHLDLLRIFIRSLRRASIPVNYSQGFSPHAKISFSPALGLGIESQAEVIDIESDKLYDTKEFIERLNGALPEGLMLTKCIILEKAPSIPTTITHSLYQYLIEDSSNNSSSIRNALDSIKNSEEIIIKKNSKKKKDVETDVRNRIVNCYMEDQSVFAILQNSVDGSLKPSEFLDILRNQMAPIDIKISKIIKIESYFIDGDDINFV